MTSEYISTLRMDLAESLTDASRSLERTRRKLEIVLEALARLQMIDSANSTLDTSVQRCRLGLSDLTTLNNDVRRMNT